MAKPTIDYGIEAIKTLGSIEAIRTRPGMYIGSVESEGVWQITLEIISNAVDEYLIGECNRICVKVDGDGKITVRDNGRGVPFGKNEEGEQVLVNVYTKLHTGAKFDSKGQTGYNTSGGMNGVGAKATNALSEFFSVDSRREGKRAFAVFKRGELDRYSERKINKVTDDWDRGTEVIFKPDIEIFKDGIKIDQKQLRKQLQELAYLSPGLTFELSIDGKIEQISSQNGLLDYLDDLCSGKSKLTTPFYAESSENRVSVRVALQYIERCRIFTLSIIEHRILLRLYPLGLYACGTGAA